VNYVSPTSSGTLLFTPAANSNGTATITVVVNDNGTSNNIITRSFTVTVNPVNDPPTLDPLSPITINEDAPQQTVNLTGISAASPNESQPISIIATSNIPGFFSSLSVNYTSPASTGTLLFTPAANSNGTAIITLVLTDTGTSNNVTT